MLSGGTKPGLTVVSLLVALLVVSCTDSSLDGLVSAFGSDVAGGMDGT